MNEKTKQRIANVAAGALMLVAAGFILAGFSGFYILADVLGRMVTGG